VYLLFLTLSFGCSVGVGVCVVGVAVVGVSDSVAAGASDRDVAVGNVVVSVVFGVHNVVGVCSVRVVSDGGVVVFAIVVVVYDVNDNNNIKHNHNHTTN